MRIVLNRPFQKIGISYNIRLRPSESKEAPNMGNAFLQFIKNRKVARVPLGIEWPLNKFDKKSNLFLPRQANDTDVNDRNIEAQQFLARVSELMVHYRLSNATVTLDKIVNDYTHFSSRENVVAYFSLKADELLKQGLVVPGTYKNWIQSINRIRAFEISTNEPLTFAHLSDSTGVRIYRYCRTQLNLAHNSSSGSIKHYKKFLRLATKDGIQYDSEALNVITNFQPGFFEALEMSELKKLIDLFDNPEELTERQHESLRKFLFSCFSGLRISDNKKVLARDFAGNRMSFTLAKGAGHIGKKLQLDLPDIAMRLIKGRKGTIFMPISDQCVNKALKRIAEIVGINKRLTFHVARNTFGTLLVEMGCDSFALKDFLGHSSISDTAKYVKAGKERKENLLRRFDSM
jgi:integrase/recombinase XerD